MDTVPAGMPGSLAADPSVFCCEAPEKRTVEERGMLAEVVVNCLFVLYVQPHKPAWHSMHVPCIIELEYLPNLNISLHAG